MVMTSKSATWPTEINEDNKIYTKQLNEATFTVSFPSAKGPGKTKNFPSLKKAKEIAKESSMEMDGFVVVMKNGIDEISYLKGKEK